MDVTRPQSSAQPVNQPSGIPWRAAVLNPAGVLKFAWTEDVGGAPRNLPAPWKQLLAGMGLWDMPDSELDRLKESLERAARDLQVLITRSVTTQAALRRIGGAGGHDLTDDELCAEWQTAQLPPLWIVRSEARTENTLPSPTLHWGQPQRWPLIEVAREHTMNSWCGWVLSGTDLPQLGPELSAADEAWLGGSDIDTTLIAGTGTDESDYLWMTADALDRHDPWSLIAPGRSDLERTSRATRRHMAAAKMLRRINQDEFMGERGSSKLEQILAERHRENTRLSGLTCEELASIKHWPIRIICRGGEQAPELEPELLSAVTQSAFQWSALCQQREDEPVGADTAATEDLGRAPKRVQLACLQALTSWPEEGEERPGPLTSELLQVTEWSLAARAATHPESGAALLSCVPAAVSPEPTLWGHQRPGQLLQSAAHHLKAPTALSRAQLQIALIRSWTYLTHWSPPWLPGSWAESPDTSLLSELDQTKPASCPPQPSGETP